MVKSHAVNSHDSHIVKDPKHSNNTEDYDYAQKNVKKKNNNPTIKSMGVPKSWGYTEICLSIFVLGFSMQKKPSSWVLPSHSILGFKGHRRSEIAFSASFCRGVTPKKSTDKWYVNSHSYVKSHSNSDSNLT